MAALAGGSRGLAARTGMERTSRRGGVGSVGVATAATRWASRRSGRGPSCTGFTPPTALGHGGTIARCQSARTG